MDVDATATVTLKLFGTSEGSATINAQASTISDESDTSTNGASAQVKVTEAAPDKHDNGGGGGAFGWLVLAALLGLVLPALTRHRRA